MFSPSSFTYIALLLGATGVLSLLGPCQARFSRNLTLFLLGISSISSVVAFAGAGLDTSRACYLLMTSLVGFAAAWHAGGYLKDASNAHQRVYWLFFNWMLCAMFMVLRFTFTTAVFLAAWELMGLFSFVLVLLEQHETSVRRAGWLYLLSCEAGGLLLILALSAYTGRLDDMPYLSITPPLPLLLLGFGLKAGFPLLHFWLPEAHPAAPAPVSAVMSGAMIPLGFFGIYTYMNPYEPNFGIATALVILGILGAFFGILSGACCPNIKRLLAYSSVENMGIAAMGFGLAMLGICEKNMFMSACGFSGAILHLLNHALLKGSLFLAAGSVLKSTGTLDMDRLGGLMKKMPLTGTCFTLSSLGICGLPPFCGFAGELLIYAAAFAGISIESGAVFALSLMAAIAMALTGAVACAAFAKAISALFLGEPRHPEAQNAIPETKSMAFPIAFLSVLAILLPFLTPFLPCNNEDVSAILAKYAVVSAVFYVIAGALLCLRRRIGTDPRRQLGTWDCGFARPTPRMQYTGSAFIQPLADLFNPFLRQHRTIQKPEGYFPQNASATATCQDFAMRFIFNPVARALHALAIQAHRLQAGYVHLYILILLVALLLLLGYGFHDEILSGGK